jgi:hypothetical protein
MLQWDKVHLSDKIQLLKELLLNSNTYSVNTENIVDALLAGSKNNHTGDIGFEMKQHHIDYMRGVWDTAIQNQKDNSVINKIKNKLNQ